MTLFTGSRQFGVGEGPMGPDTAFTQEDGHLVACGTSCGDSVQSDFFPVQIADPPLFALPPD